MSSQVPFLQVCVCVQVFVVCVVSIHCVSPLVQVPAVQFIGPQVCSFCVCMVDVFEFVQTGAWSLVFVGVVSVHIQRGVHTLFVHCSVGLQRVGVPVSLHSVASLVQVPA